MSHGVHRRGGAATAQVGAWLYSTWVELEELHADFLVLLKVKPLVGPRTITAKVTTFPMVAPYRDEH